MRCTHKLRWRAEIEINIKIETEGQVLGGVLD